MRRLALLFLLPALALAVFDMKWFDLNHWRSPFYNDGRWGIDITVGTGVAAGTWPQPLHNCYVFGAGPWFAAIVPSPSPETLCTVMYNPNSGGTEMCPTLCRYWREGYTNIRDRIYKYPGDWPPSHSRFPMAPLENRSDMDMWCCFSDSDPTFHISPGRPLGIDVFLTVCGYSDSLAQDFFFLKYELANCSGDSIRQAYFGMALDADIGDATDDMTGLILNQLFHVGPDTIRVKNTGFVYDYNNVEGNSGTWDSGTPGAVAIMLLSAPESLGLTACMRLSLDIDPATDAQQYQTLAGYDWRTGIYNPYDSIDLVPGDKQVVLSTGPFDLAPESTVTFCYAVVGSPFGDSAQLPEDRDTTELALRCRRARMYFEQLTGVSEASREVPTAAVSVGPNPCSPASPLRIRAAGMVEAQVFDIGGRLVRTIRGRECLTWSGTDSQNRRVPGGVYFVKVAHRGRTYTAKVLLVDR